MDVGGKAMTTINDHDDFSPMCDHGTVEPAVRSRAPFA
jgi:hypothetical protein